MHPRFSSIAAGKCLTLLSGAILLAACARPAALPPVHSAVPSPPLASEEDALVEHQPICIGSRVASAGRLGDVLFYRARRFRDGRIAVGYFAFYSDERPWGNNWLTWSVIPALAVDLVYTRSFLIGPGLQRLVYGAGDVEGVGAVYDVHGDTLKLDYAFAERRHRRVVLSRDDALALDATRPTFYASSWDHQLGGRGARTPADLAAVHCYDRDHLKPLPDNVVHAFRLQGRARPAHVERLHAMSVPTMAH